MAEGGCDPEPFVLITRRDQGLAMSKLLRDRNGPHHAHDNEIMASRNLKNRIDSRINE